MGYLDSIDIGLTLLWLFSIVVAIAVAAWLGYWRPRTRAFKSGQRSVPVLFGAGVLVLWNPGETFLFLRGKRLRSVGDENGGMRLIFPFRGDEAVGPVPLRMALYEWHDENVLTREAQALLIKLGIWWKVSDPRIFAFRIYDKTQSKNFNRVVDEAIFHAQAEHWINVLTDSSVRSNINRLGVADVVSAQATKFLQDTGDHDDQSPHAGEINGAFEVAMNRIINEVRTKALEYGIEIGRLEVQHVHLPDEIQSAINETRKAFLAPIKSEREAEAAKISLEKLATVLGKDTVAMNVLLGNLRGATFVTPFNFMQSLFSGLDKKSAAAMGAAASASDSRSTLPEREEEPAQRPDAARGSPRQ